MLNSMGTLDKPNWCKTGPGLNLQINLDLQ